MLRAIIRRLAAVVVAAIGANALFFAYTGEGLFGFTTPTVGTALENGIGGVMFLGLAVWLWSLDD